VKVVNGQGLGCAEANLDYDETSARGTVHSDMLDISTCYTTCIASSACVIAVYDGIDKKCTEMTRYVPDSSMKTWFAVNCIDEHYYGLGTRFPW
jgi:hypothetical protein